MRAIYLTPKILSISPFGEAFTEWTAFLGSLYKLILTKVGYQVMYCGELRRKREKTLDRGGDFSSRRELVNILGSEFSWRRRVR